MLSVSILNNIKRQIRITAYVHTASRQEKVYKMVCFPFNQQLEKEIFKQLKNKIKIQTIHFCMEIELMDHIGNLEPIPAGIPGKAGYTLNSLVHHTEENKARNYAS